MEKCYGVSVGEQFTLERYFDEMDEIRPIYHPIVTSWVTQEQWLYHETYVFRRNVGNHPVFALPLDKTTLKVICDFIKRSENAKKAKVIIEKKSPPRAEGTITKNVNDALEKWAKKWGVGQTRTSGAETGPSTKN